MPPARRQTTLLLAGASVTAASGPLGPRETMTIAVGFADGTFTPFDSSYFATPWAWLHTLAALGLPHAVIH